MPLGPIRLSVPHTKHVPVLNFLHETQVCLGFDVPGARRPAPVADDKNSPNHSELISARFRFAFPAMPPGVYELVAAPVHRDAPILSPTAV